MLRSPAVLSLSSCDCSSSTTATTLQSQCARHHHCDNRNNFECQLPKRGARLKCSSAPAPSPRAPPLSPIKVSSHATQSSPMPSLPAIASTVTCWLVQQRLARVCDGKSRSTAAIGVDSNASRSASHLADCSRTPCHNNVTRLIQFHLSTDCCNATTNSIVSPRATMAARAISTPSSRPSTTNLTNRCCLFYWMLVLFSISFLSVISASRFVQNRADDRPRPYSHYYPAYIQDDPVRPIRTGKSNHRVFDSNLNNREYLDPTTFSGGEIVGIKVLRSRQQTYNSNANYGQLEPDYKITSDIFIPANSRLEIEPGVRLAFAPKTGITVRGALVANGTSSSRITFTSIADLNKWPTAVPSLSPVDVKPFWPSIRLVDGSSFNEGRLQINYKGKWHSLCTNSRNWTTVDVNVVCGQLGFAGGHWFRWFSRNNDTRQFMYEFPGCQGKEVTVQDCPNWSARRVGSGICDFHQDIGIRCDSRMSPSSQYSQQSYWRGIQFLSSDSQISSILSNKMEISVSKSLLEHVTIEYAGQGSDDSLTAALSVYAGVPPVINEVTIRRSVYTALNITDPMNGFQVTNSRFIGNRGYGIYVNSSVGRIFLSSVEIEENGADGIRFIHFDKPFYSSDSFCQTPNLGKGQVFPIRYTHKQSSSKAPNDECCQEFYAKDWEGQRVTAHFPVMMSGIDNFDSTPDLIYPHYTPPSGREGSIYVVDGHSGRIIADFFIRNNTKIQSISSIFGNGPLRICYRPAHYRNVLFTVEVVVDYSREFDLVVADSRIVANNGRGVWLQDLRSGSVLNRTLVSRHDYVAGVHVSNGVGEMIVNNSIISNNLADGVNVTNGGGYLHIDRTDIVNNTDRGVAVWFNESIYLQSFNYSSHITRCSLSNNRISLLISGGCHFHTPLKQSAFWNISMNHFVEQSEQSILYHSCIPRPRILKMQMKPIITNLSISHNRFVASGFQAIHIAPLFFAKVDIAHNEFTRHQKAVLYINSRDSFNVEKFVEDAERFPFTFYTKDSLTNQRNLALDSWPTSVRIRNNNFYKNNGFYVASIGLLEPESSKDLTFGQLSQKVFFTRNVLRDNVVTEPFVNLNSRSKVASVLCISSSNVYIWRNEFVNPESKYELGIHLASHYRTINASLNYWGTWRTSSSAKVQFSDKNLNSAALIYERIFDRKNRYNLAQVEFLPYILVPNALESDQSALSQVNDREKISTFFSESSSGEIGGQVRGQVDLPSGVYHVKRDIYISPEGELVLNAGTELRFDQSVGILVQGKFKAKGASDADIKFLLATSSTVSRRTRNATTITQSSINPLLNFSSNLSHLSKKSVESVSKPIASKLSFAPSFSGGTSSSSVRLSNGTNGRLEVKIENEWGTVCGYNFDINDASIVCHQLGFVLNERDWRLEKSQFWSAGNSRSILLSNVRCSHLDTDLTKCKAERTSDNDFESGWCPMGEVGIRCYPTAWAGIRFGMLTQEAIIESVTIERAGLFDYRTREFAPALKFDFNRFAIRNSIIRSNIDSGLGLMWNDVISEQNDDMLQISDTKILSNLNHGIVTRTQGIQLKNCHIAENKASGFHYEPNFSREEQEELTSWVVKQSIRNRRISVLVIPSVSSSQQSRSIYLGDIGKQIYVYIPRRPKPSDSPYRISLSTDVGRRIGVVAISPIFQTRSTESLRLYSPQLESSYIPKMLWDLRRNLTSFPFVYPGYRLTLEYSTGELPYGGILLLFTPKQYLRSVPGSPTISELELIEQRHMNTMHLFNNEFVQNGKGITASHCSMNIDFNGNYCKRYANETILIEKNSIVKSKGAGLFVNSYAFSSSIPYSFLLNSNEFSEIPQEYEISFSSSIIAEINYTLIENRFVNNADHGSIVLYDHSLYESGDMQKSNLQLMPGHIMSGAIGTNYPSNTNLFHWNIIRCSMEDNRNGGLDIRLPYTWLYNENFTHTVVIEDSSFAKNHNFEFRIGGHYAKVNISRNNFNENHCKTGLLSITGMEKLIKIDQNQLSNNYVQRYVIELNIASHADKFGTVNAYVRQNVIQNNRYAGPVLRENQNGMNEATGYSPETYTISIRGVQQVNVTRNVLVNRNLQFELLAGVRAGSLYNELDARENWWGVGGDPSAIRERIFDFDDWNSFATTLYSPWLSADRIDAPFIYEQPIINDSLLSPYYLGGRLSESMVLVARDRPYIVNTDLTVMPGATLTIRPGVVIEFYPSVGILVLGDLLAVGMEKNPITLCPLRRNITTVVRSTNNGEDILFRMRSTDISRNRRLASQPRTEPLVFSKSDIGGVRLCLTETCDTETEREANNRLQKESLLNNDSEYPKSENGRNRHGFLEIYNTTTLHWAPVCDSRFTERNAQVVCRQLGFSTLNVFVRRGPRPDMDSTLTSRINHWPEALECSGTEPGLSDCDLRTFSKDGFDKKTAEYESAPFYNSKGMDNSFFIKNNYYHYISDNQTREMIFYFNDDWRVLEERSLIQSTSCRYDGNEFVYVFCGDDNNNDLQTGVKTEHWGGVRFALSAFEELASELNEKKKFLSSTMQYVNVIGAGILHGEKNAAIQLIQRSIPIQFVKVEQSASHGIEVIAPPDSLSLHQLQIKRNLGTGLNILLLGSSSSETARIPYQPLGDGPSFSVPYNAFSLVDICDARKELKINEKVIVYYKYDNRPVDCVKIFTSANPLKRIGLRFLQLNLWSTFGETEGKANRRIDDYIQGRKYFQHNDDIFHNQFGSFDDDDGQAFVDKSFLNSMSDSVLIWDGDIFNETTRHLLGEVYSDLPQDFQYSKIINSKISPVNDRIMRNSRYVSSASTKQPNIDGNTESNFKTKLYKSSGFSLSIQLHASGASGRHGFIAEIVTLPSAYYVERVGRDLQHNITYSEVSDNTAGAILYRSVGESIPPFALHHDVFTNNCRHGWGNFSTCESSTIQLEMQNAQHLYFQNNLIQNNRAGGLRIRATSYTSVSAINAYLINNLFSDNLHKEALYFEGTGLTYQTIHANRNYFTRNRSPYWSNIVFGRAVVKFHENVIINNYGDSQLFIAGFAHAQSSSNLQRCTRNFFYNNHAINERGERSTIIANTVGQIYTDNYLVNPDNNFELSTRNRTIITSAQYQLRQSILEPTAVAAVLASAIIQAPYNWWGFNETSAIEARIRDSHDYYHLIPVEFKPFYAGNWSVLSGSCYGGYEKIGDTCFVYVGGRMKYHDARRFCEKDNSSMPFVRASNQAELTRYVYIQQPDFNRRRHPVWVQSFDVSIGSCSVLIEGTVRVHNCEDTLPFLCERDPEIGISTSTLDFWYQEPLGIAAIAISFITAILCCACIFCWVCKSRHRHLEKMERRNSIRASIRSSRSFASSMNTLNDTNYLTSRKLLHESSHNLNTPISQLNENMPIYQRQAAHLSSNPTGQSIWQKMPQNGSMSSTLSIFSDPNINDDRLNPTAKRFISKPKANIFDISEREPTHNSNLNLLMRPSYDLMYENQAFKGQSTPLSPASISSSRDDNPQINRVWTPDTNSTLDFKVKPHQIDTRELSQYTASTDNLNKSLPSSSSTSTTSESASPTSILSRSSQLRNLPPSRQVLRPPGHPPPPAPFRRPMSVDKNAVDNRKSMDPTLLLHEQEHGLPEFTRHAHAPDREMLTFGAKRKAAQSKRNRQPFVTDLDADIIGGSQPSLLYGQYKGPPSKGGHDSNMHYLETSIDGDSFYNENFIDDSANQSITTAATSQSHYDSQPLETAM